jgi:hypothetical protein
MIPLSTELAIAGSGVFEVVSRNEGFSGVIGDILVPPSLSLPVGCHVVRS